jgi:hypothetical protein
MAIFPPPNPGTAPIAPPAPVPLGALPLGGAPPAAGFALPAFPAPPEGPPQSPWPAAPKRRLRGLDADLVRRSVRERVQSILEDRDRGDWMAKRLQRYAKYRGWLRDKTFPWTGAANVHPPVLQIAELRANAGLHNAILSMRPLMSAKATSRVNVAREDRITALLDTQMFLDPGPDRVERTMSDFVSMFLQDGNAVAYTPWVRETREVTTSYYRPAIPVGETPDSYLAQVIGQLLPDADLHTLEQHPTVLNRYRVETPLGRVTCTVYTADDGSLELVVTQPATLFDGPVMLPLAIEDVLVRTRAQNLQPPSEANPGGAPEVFVRVHFRLDQIRRFQASGKFNWLTRDDLATVEGWARAARGSLGAPLGGDADALQAQKDALEGQEHREPATTTEADLGHVWIPGLMAFDQWDLDGTGFGEDAYWMLLYPPNGAGPGSDEGVLAEARRLSELYPGTVPWRPLAEAACIPVPGRYYAISMLELGEALYDLIKSTMDLAYDSAVVGNLPFFFYSAQAKLATEAISIAPGMGYPVPGDPRAAIYFPQLSQRDQQWAFQFIGLAAQLFEKVEMVGDLQQGRVPTGKASALRTVGTTQAILQQGDVRADQLLLRLFGGLRQVARNFHRLNRHLLPPGKELRRLGWDGVRAEGYLTIEDPADIDAEVDFDFRPDFLLSNGAAQAATLQTMLGVLTTPLAFRAGVTNPALFYNALKDYTRALKLDPARYLMPPSAPGGAPLLAEEAIDLILQNQLPEGSAAEGNAPHYQKLMDFLQSDQFGHLSPAQVQLFKAHLKAIQDRIQTDHLADAASQFQATMQQQMGSTTPTSGGVATSGQEPPLATPAAMTPPSVNGGG